MTDTTVQVGKREATSKREWLDAEGKVTTDEGKATGGRYTITLAAHKDQSLDFYPKSDDFATRMAAIFGWHTRMGNDVNTWKHEKGERAATPIEACQETMDLWAQGIWAASAAGGFRVDKDVLAQAVCAMIPTLQVDAVRAKLDDAEFFKTVRNNNDITAKYAELKGKATASLDDVLGLMGASA